MPACESCGTSTLIECGCCGRCAEDYNERDQVAGLRRLNRRRKANGLPPLDRERREIVSARDAALRDVCAALDATGRAYSQRHLPFGRVEVSTHDDPAPYVRALIYPDGRILRTWADGTRTREGGEEHAI